MPNILTPAQECAKISHGFDCGNAQRTGDVLKCKHGRYWLFHRLPAWLRKDGEGYGYWTRIDVVSEPITWWRARRALLAEEKATC